MKAISSSRFGGLSVGSRFRGSAFRGGVFDASLLIVFGIWQKKLLLLLLALNSCFGSSYLSSM